MMSNHPARTKLTDTVFKYIALVFTVFALGILVVLLVDIFSRGMARINWDFFRNLPSRHAEKSGIMTALAGMLSLLFFTVIIALPIGILAGIYLQEYGKKNRLAKFIEINIANLAGVPSVIYGILGLTLFVRILKLGNSLIAGALTLSLLILPFIPEGPNDQFTTLPIQVFNWTSRPQAAFIVNAAAGIIVLLLITFLLNGIAIYIRNKWYKKIRY